MTLLTGSALLWFTAKFLVRMGALSLKPSRMTVNRTGLQIEELGQTYQWGWADITGMAMRTTGRGGKFLELSLKDTARGYPSAKPRAIQLTNLWKTPVDDPDLDSLKDIIGPVWRDNAGKAFR